MRLMVRITESAEDREGEQRFLEGGLDTGTVKTARDESRCSLVFEPEVSQILRVRDEQEVERKISDERGCRQ